MYTTVYTFIARGGGMYSMYKYKKLECGERDIDIFFPCTVYACFHTK